MSERRLLVVHVDGLGHDILLRAVERGNMPFTGALLRHGYEAQPYRCGVPSTTPYAQAGILYGDNTNIPGFRWWDKQSGTSIRFGVKSSFKQIAHRYFQGREGLCTGGACIAACYPAGAEKTFGLAFKERQYRTQPGEGRRVGLGFIRDPRHIADIGWHVAYTTAASVGQYVTERARHSAPVVPYMAGDIAEEIVVHNMTRYAVQQSMRDGEPAIYAGFYAYDEAAHGFGPENDLCWRMLGHLDRTLRALFETGADYEVVVLSDHGSSPTRSFKGAEGRELADVISEWLPRYQIVDLKGKKFGPRGDALDGHLMLAASGGLAHLYLAEQPGRLSRQEVDRVVPDLIERLAQHALIHFVLARDGDQDVVLTASGPKPLEGSRDLLQAFDDPEILIGQLRKLNSFETAGDVIVFGRWDGREQVNFEHQLGGHGSLGGEQNRPFVLSRAGLLDVRGVTDASELYALLRGLRPPAA